MRLTVFAIAAAALLSAAAVSAPGEDFRQGGPAYPLPAWMQGDGSSSDHPTPMRSDHSGDALNHAYRHGLVVLGSGPRSQ